MGILSVRDRRLSSVRAAEKPQGLHISLEPMAPDGGRAGGPDVGDTAELLPAVRVGDVDLHRGDPHAFTASSRATLVWV